MNTIISLATSTGISALSIIRLSGEDSISIVDNVFKGKKLSLQASHTVHYGKIVYNNVIIDEVLVTIFKAPNSFTKENSVEISCHSSEYIVRQIIQCILKNGARLAKPGEFTQRAFLNGRFDLAQAEAVADLIASDSETSHRSALNQMRGGFSNQIKKLREQLIWFASLIELELDFGEEDVEFADRKDLRKLINELQSEISILIESFNTGNAIKNGIPTVIIGKPNAGKSTLLNALLNEEKAIVSEIPGTTRDFIEDTLVLDGITFRFIDTAGLRETEDKVEKMGVERTKEKIKQASLVLYLFDLVNSDEKELLDAKLELETTKTNILFVANKIDLANEETINRFSKLLPHSQTIYISADKKTNMNELKTKILEAVKSEKFKTGNTIVTNVRHYESLIKTNESLENAINGLNNGITGDIIAMDVRHALHYLGEITGEITTEDLLETIFSKFCIGK